MADLTYRQFLVVRIIGGIVILGVLLWGVWILLGLFREPDQSPLAHVENGEPSHGAVEAETVAHPAVVPPMDHEAAPTIPTTAGPSTRTVVGVHFVGATISVLDYELNERFWGWRRNDLVRFTDNVEHMQLGVLEVVRRTSVALAERISRYSAADAIDKNLENAMHWFVIKPDRYWLPSAEEKYDDGLQELRHYAEKLEMGEARFYVRADNLIPLLSSFVDLLGSCDENLVKAKEEDGSRVSWFRVDDYFYYAKGVARAMGEILRAAREDFSSVLEGRHGVDLLEHAIHACHVASELDPWLVTDGDLDGVLANHRANMAAPISHARYFLDALSKALST